MRLNSASKFSLSPLPSAEELAALELSAIHLMAVDRFRDLAREALLTQPATVESYQRSQIVTAAWKAVERAAARANTAAGFPVEALDFTPVESMDRHQAHLPAALDFVRSAYKSSLAGVASGGLIESLTLDAVLKAIRHEMEAAEEPTSSATDHHSVPDV